MAGRGLRGNPVAWAFGALLVVALLALPLGYERVEEEVDDPPSGLARLNPYHGLGEVLEELGVPARGSFGLVQLPDREQTVVLASEDPAARRKLWDRLGPWVLDGGHLVVLPAGGPTTAWDELLGDTGVAGELDEAAWDILDSLVVDIVEGGDAETGASAEVVSPDGRRRVLAAAPDAHIQAEHQLAAAWLTDDERLWAVRWVHGDGLITVVSDAAPLRNDALGQADHALLGWELLRRPSGPAAVTFVLGGESRSLAAVAWRAAGPLVVSCFVMLGLLGWRGAVRTGPVLPDPRPDRRDLMEHVAASGTFLWRHDLQDGLLGPARAAVRRRLGLRRGGSLDDASLLDAAMADSMLADGALADGGIDDPSSPAPPALDERDLRAALLDPVPSAPQAFLAAVRTLQQLWRPR